MIIFLGYSGLPVFLNVGTKLTHITSLHIYRRLIRKVTNVFLKTCPTIYGLTLVTTFRDLGLAIEDFLFIHTFNFGPVPLAFTPRGKEEVRQLLKQLDIHSPVHLPTCISLT